MTPPSSITPSPTFISSVASEPLLWLIDSLHTLGSSPSLLSSTPSDQWRASSPSPLRRLSQLTASASLLLRALRHHPPSPLRPWIIVSTPPWLPFLFAATQPLHRHPFSILVHDLFPKTLAARFPHLPKTLRAIALIPWRFTLQRAHSVIFIGERMAAHARAHTKLNTHTVIYTGAPTLEPCTPPRTDDAPNTHPNTHPLRASYLGYLGHMHDWKTLRDAIPLIARSPEIDLTISASGPGYKKLFDSFNAPKMTSPPPQNIRWLPPLSATDWRAALRASDVSLISLSTDARAASFPSKMFSAISASNALIAITDYRSDLADFILTHRCGIICPPGDHQALLAALNTLATQPDTLAEMKRRAYQASLQHSMTAVAQQWLAFLGKTSPITIGNETL